MAVAQKLCCKVLRIADHGEHVYTIDLVSGKLFPVFKPGQFLHLALDAYDPSGYWPDSRVFSIASPSHQRERLSITYSVRGRFTARMEEELTEAKTVWVKMPYGDFVIQSTADVVLLAGGTGITAFTAFLSGLSANSAQKVYLAYGARTADLLIYRNPIDQCTKKARHLRHWYFVEDGHVDPYLPGLAILGKLSVKEIWGQIDDPFASTFYLSGPPEMIKAILHDLQDRGVGIDAIRVDAWE
jgi:ferredoxin-NADP reductase